MREIYTRAEKMLLQDKYNNSDKIDVISKDLEKFLCNYIVFDSDEYSVNADLTDKLQLTIKVNVKQFKNLNTNRDKI